MKKSISLILILVLCMAMFAACGGGGAAGSSAGSAAPASSAAASSEAEVVGSAGGNAGELVIWHHFSSASTKPAVEGTFDKYNEVQSDVTVRYDMLPRNDHLKQMTLGVVAGTLPDMASIDNPDYCSMSAMGAFADITDWFNGWSDSSVFIDAIMASGYYQDRLYGVPFAPNCLALWCNKAMLDEAGIDKAPETWDEFYAAAEKLTKDGVYGYAIASIKDESSTFQHLPWIMSADGDIFDLTSEGSLRALNFLGDMYEKGYISKESINWNQSDVLKQFTAGNAAMILSGNWNVATIRTEAPDLEYTLSAIPRDKNSVTCLGGEVMGITTNCKEPEQAYKFMEWFLSKEVNAELVAQCTRFSPRSDVPASDLYPGDEVMAFYVDILPDAYARGPHPKWTEVSVQFQTAIQEAWTGTKDVDTAMTEAAKKIADIDASV